MKFRNPDDGFARFDGGDREAEVVEESFTQQVDETPLTDEPIPQKAGSLEGGLDSVRLYLRDAQRHPRLTEGEALRCARGMRNAAQEIAEAAEPARETLASFQADRGRMIQGSLGLVIAIARDYQHLRLPLGDLIQEGNLGLMSAVRKFDPERKVRFVAYATGWIRQAMCRALSQKSRMIRIPLGQLALRRQAARVHSDLEQRYHNEACRTGKHRSHTTEDDAREMGVDPGVLRSNLRAMPEVESLDGPTRGGGSLASLLPDQRAPNPRDRAAESEQRQHVQDAVAGLPTRLRHIVRRRYGLVGEGEASLAEIGLEMHLTPERVRQLTNRALRLLRQDAHCRAVAP